MERGEIVWAEFSYNNANPHRINKMRPCIIVSPNACTPNCVQPLVIPLSTSKDDVTGIHPTISSSSKVSQALCEQLIPLNVKNIHDTVGSLTAEEQEKVDKGMMTAIGCIKYYNKCKCLEEDNNRLRETVDKLKSALRGVQNELDLLKASNNVDVEAMQIGVGVKMLLQGMRNIVSGESHRDRLEDHKDSCNYKQSDSQPNHDEINVSKSGKYKWTDETQKEYITYYKEHGAKAAAEKYNLTLSSARTNYSRFRSGLMNRYLEHTK